MNALQEQFIAEARELVHQATDDLIAVEREGASGERIDRIFRAFHTLKGSAVIVELPPMTSTLHAAEDLLGDHCWDAWPRARTLSTRRWLASIKCRVGSMRSRPMVRYLCRPLTKPRQ